MNCARIAKLLPLYVGDDLASALAEQARAHLAVCATCSAEAAALAESHAWLTSVAPPQFDEACFDDLRASVRRELSALDAAPAWWQVLAQRWQPLLASACALLLLLGAWTLSRVSQQAPPVPKLAQTNDTPPGNVGLPPERKPAADGVQSTAFRRPRLLRRAQPSEGGTLNAVGVVVAAGGKEHEKETLAAETEEGGVDAESKEGKQPVNVEPEMLRIELQTADPNIRIIWFAPKPDAAAPNTK